jgi:hypothetical protein
MRDHVFRSKQFLGWMLAACKPPWWLFAITLIQAVILAAAGWAIWNVSSLQRQTPLYRSMFSILPQYSWAGLAGLIALLMAAGVLSQRARIAAVATVLASIWWVEIVLLLKRNVPQSGSFLLILLGSQSLLALVLQTQLWCIEWQRGQPWRRRFVDSSVFALSAVLLLGGVLPIYLSDLALSALIAPLVMAFMALVASVTTLWVSSRLKTAENAPLLAATREKEAMERITSERESLRAERDAPRTLTGAGRAARRKRRAA